MLEYPKTANRSPLVLVEDPALREALGDLLAGAGYLSVTAADWPEARQTLERCTPCVVLLDLDTSRKSAFEVADEPALSAVPIVGLFRGGSPLGALPAAVRHLLTKPVEFPSLLRLVQRYC